ncbi:MAG: hypothetical protein ACO4CS_14615 [bacterium]
MNNNEYKDLGWANGWIDEPIELVQCHEAGHTVRWKHDHEQHVTETVCEQCKYIYHADTSG